MEYVYLSGFVQLLQDLLGALFDAVLSPVIRDVFNILINILGELVQEILSNFLLKLWIIFLKPIYFLEQIFNVFSGISPVQIKDVSEKTPLLTYFFTLDTIQTAFLMITAASMALAFLCTIYGVAKSISDMALSDKTPLSTVLRQAFQAAVSFAIIPISCLFLLQMTTTIIAVVNTTFNYENEDCSVSDMLFIAVAEPAASGNSATAAKTVTKYSSGQNYTDGDAVKEDFDIEEFDYVMAFVSSCCMALILLCSILQFIQRIIIILFLYLASPFFVAMIPLDGGAKFKEWKNMFVAYMISAFGPIITMKLFFIVVPMVTGGSIEFSVNNTYATWVRLFFILGGAFAVYRSRLLIVQVINPMAAGAMAETGMIGSMIGGRLSGGLNRVVRSAGKGGGKGSPDKGGSGGSASDSSSASSDQYKTQSQAYTGK